MITGWPERDRELLADGAREDVGRAARRERHDPLDRLRRPRLRVRKRGERRERRSSAPCGDSFHRSLLSVFGLCDRHGDVASAAFASIPTDAAAAIRSDQVLSSSGTPLREPRGAIAALDVARRQHGLTRLRRRRRLHEIDEAPRLARDAAVGIVDVRRDVDRQHVVAQDRIVGIRAAAGRHRAGEQVGDHRQPRALVRADGEQRAAVVEILRLRRRRAVACR